MKKISLFISALAGLFLAASCQRENLEPVGGNIVTYTVQVPGAIGTKAIGTDVSNVTELIYEVYRIDENGDETKLYQKKATLDNGSASVELELVNNQDFRVLFWAQVPDNGVYTTDNLTEVTLKTALSANAENYAAFAGQDEITYGENLVGRTITLVRPVAQLNIATSAESLKLGEDGNGENAQTTVGLETTAVTVTGLSCTYNVAEGSAGAEEETFTYSAAAVALSEETIKVGDIDYTYVAMNYVGFAQPTGDDVTVTYTINTTNVGVIENTIENVPVKPNYRTNIIGNLITSTSDYDVKLSEQWGGEEIVEIVSVSTAADLQQAIDNISEGVEGNIKIENDIDLGTLADLISAKAGAPTYGLLIPANKTVVLDLNGCALSQTVEQTAAYSLIKNEGELTITDSKGTGKISYTDKGNGGNYASNTILNSGKMTIEAGIIENNSVKAVAANGYPHPIDNNGQLTINGGTIANNADYSSMRIWCTTDDNTNVTVNGGTFNGAIDFHNVNGSANKGVLTINGGTFNPDEFTKTSVRLLGFGLDVDELYGYINGGTFNGEIKRLNYTGGGEFNSEVFEITGGTFAVDPSEYVAEGYAAFVNEAGSYSVEKLPIVAKIDEAEYLSLADALKAVKEGETITILEGTLEEGTIKLPSELKNVTFKGEEGTVLKDMTIMSYDGNSIDYEGLTFEGLTFDNSRITITGWRANGVVVKAFTVTNCVFKNLEDDTSSAPVHINMAAKEAVNGFTFTNNVIDGATGSSKSGVYAQVTGETLVSGNVINNVAFRPYVIQITTDDGVADNFIVTGNTFSNSSAGRAQGLGNTAEGTDAVKIVVSDNIFKDITNAQQICYWNFNDATTEVDLSGNYYDVDILANPSKIYYNGAASGIADLKAKTIFPIYTALNADGTINKDSAYTPVYVAKLNGVEYYSLQAAFDDAKDDATITLVPNVEYDVVYLGRPTKSNSTTMYCDTDGFTSTDANEFKQHLSDGAYHTTPKYTTTLRNLTVVGAEGATIAGLVATSGHIYNDVYDYVLERASDYYSTLYMSDILFSNVNFTGKVDINTSDTGSEYDGVTFDGCTFTTGGTDGSNSCAVRYYNESNNGKVRNIVVNNCNFTNSYQGVYVHNVNGVTVTDSEFDTTGHNAVAIQSTNEPVDLKTVVITGNTFKNIKDRVIRFGQIGADSNITIQNNTATESGDENREIMRAVSIAEGITTTISGNNWNGGVVANTELEDK